MSRLVNAQESVHRLSSSLVPAPPLIIVSAQGHSDESRRIVRAQAARASAAQSRVTRARNREGRERETPLSPAQHGQGTHGGQRLQSTLITSSSRVNLPTFDAVHDAAGDAPPAKPVIEFGEKPMMRWALTLLNLPPGTLCEGMTNFKPAPRYDLSPLKSIGRIFPGPQRPDSRDGPSNGEINVFQLPVALPRGFARLQQRLPISSPMLALLSRTACVDFVSPGVEHRLHQLLYDLVVASAGRDMSSVPDDRHPIEGHLRVACTCLTIVLLRQTNPSDEAYPLQQYTDGFLAAYNETLLLDRRCLFEENSAEVALWAMFVISVTTGATASCFSEQLRALLADMQLHYWEPVRRVLLDFIYPASFLDQPCKDFYQTLCRPPARSTRNHG